MKISIDINEAEIIKNVLNGVDKKQIEKQLCQRVQEDIIQVFKTRIVQHYCNETKTDNYNFDVVIEKVMKKKMLSEMKSIFKSWISGDDSDMDDKVREILGDYIDEWLKNNEIEFSFIHKVNKSK